MADIEPPSFSLGFDLDIDSELQPEPETSTGNNFSKPAKRSSVAIGLRSNGGGDDDFETPPMGLGPPVLGPTSTLKRLRRGPALAAQRRESKEEKFIVDDDIEEFSSQDDQPPGKNDAPKHHYSVCSSSKFPLNGHGPHAFLASQSAKQLNENKKKNFWNSSASPDKEAISHKLVFPELHASPLRKFQLIESDSDEASPSKGPNEVVNRVDLHSKDGKYTFGQVGTAGELKKTKAPDTMSQADDLWKEIRSDRSFRIPTPALDEICEEYFRFVKDKNESRKFDKGCCASNNLRKNETQQIASGPPHPAYHYYYHDDSRIQMLLRARLPHFLPLSCGNNQGLKQHNASTINYMSQFNHGEASKRGKKNHNTGPSSTRSQKNSRKSSVVDVQEESDSWINPRRSDKTAKDAGKKRVRGACKSAGHWYTAADGRRVYVAGNGQELTGQIAYRQYKRDSGAGFKRSNKKAASKKKATRKKK